MSAKKPTKRAIHLIDLENLIGSGRFTSASAGLALQIYRTRVHIGPSDLEIVGVSSGAAMLAVHRAGFTGRLAFVKGHDGADKALIEIMSNEGIHERFERLYCASGDGGFTDIVAHLGRHGAHVTVVANPKGLSKQLRMAARDVISINVWTTDLEAA